MTIGEALRAKLLAAAAVVAVLGPGDHVYVAHVPARTQRKHVVIHGPGGDPGVVHLGGASATATPLQQLECWGATPGEATAVANAVDATLNGTRGTFGELFVHTCVRRDRRGPTPQDALDGSDAPVFSVQLDYFVGHDT